MEREVHGERRSEPVFKAPWPAVLLVASMPALFWLQTLIPDQEALFSRYALQPVRTLGGDWKLLLTSMFLHKGWAHALINAGFAFAFAPPVARLFGVRPAGVAAFLGFYLVCGVAGGLSYVLANPHSDAGAIGASGAVSGLLGAAMRLLNPERRPGPIFAPTVIAATVAFVVLNVVIGPTNLNPGAGGSPVAWQDHIGGYFAGLLLIGVWARLFARPEAAPPLELEPVREPPFEAPPR